MADGKSNVLINVSKPGGVGAAAKEFQDLAKAANDAAKAVKAASGAASNGPLGELQKAHRNGAGSMGGAGGLAGLAGRAGGPLAVIAATAKVMDGVAKAANILGNSFTTGAQKADAFIKEFVPMGETIIKFRDALDGTADAMARNAQAFDVQKAQDEAKFAARSKLGAAGIEAAGYQASFLATQRIGIGGYQTFDRSTLAGERAAGVENTTIGARDAETQARREAEAARLTARYAAQAAKEADDRVKAQQGALARAQGELGSNTAMENRGFRDKGGRDAAGRSVLLESDRLSKELQAREEAIGRAKEAGLKAVQAEAAARAASVNLAKSELQVLEQQETRMRGMAQGAGAMSQGEFMAAGNALKMYQDAGGNAPPEIESLVAKIAPDLVRKNQENRGGDRIEQLKGVLGDKGFADAFGEDFGKGNSLKEVMQKVDKAKADIRVTIDLDAQSTAKQLSEILKPVLQNLIGSLQVEMKNLEGRIKAGAIVRNNAAN